MSRSLELLVRAAVAAEFIGHGLEALRVKAEWIPFITLFGYSVDQARILMPLVGALDVLLGLSVLVRPMRGPLLWMVAWAFFTTTLRPLTGLGLLAMVERGANWGAPLALLLLRGGLPRRWADLWR